MYKDLMNFYNFRMSSLLYILDNTKHLEKYNCKKEDVLNFGGTHYCIDDSVNTIDSWAVPHNESGISPNIPIYSGDVPFGVNKKRYEVRGY
jgi:hypothetical protein